ncbi:energy-coupling factor ABC transporter substrate-binding protein [Geobacillus sp. Y412MC52]|uniref:energy-coupling factor ABC transporter substrate-binding protein n=1 Tax=Geobacillus sp. (strain Y412MC52) TaxID=550542 RepID=UPI00018C0D38|nr:energy-coupling factor ABC transporter substrate-binding protein [Geobacillus sp. Y412MC52]ADU94182.1 Cobalt transport protein CbiN [Geobacillus sp. Y412MC52]ALA71864.1 cobalamin biosynthesis protein CbiN [Geobacillus stearothermophilus 10]
MKKNRLLLLLAALSIVVPLWWARGSAFGGTDDQAEKAIQAINPHYRPWFESIFTLPGGEVETLLFSLQAALGAGVIGYVVGLYKGRSERENSHDSRV